MWRRPRRRRRRWRRGRYYPRYRRPLRRHRFWRRHRQVRTLNVTENVPQRHRLVIVRGWEPLGNVCPGTGAKIQAEPYAAVEPALGGQGKFQGTWGFHYFTLANLLNRAYANWCTFSDNWSSFDYIKFLRMNVRIIPTLGQTWMINFDQYLQTKNVLSGEQNNENQWIHPGVLLNTPKTHIIFNPAKFKRRRLYKIPIKPPPGWKGYERLPGAMDYVLTHWSWTWCDLENAFYDWCPCNNTSDRTQCVANPWWGVTNRSNQWVNRTKYADCIKGQSKNETWGPFLPGNNCERPAFSAYFLYTIYFKFAGDSLWRPLPTSFNREGMVPPAPGPPNTKADSRKSSHKRRRPQDTGDIWPGDLDADGILTTPALKRIAGDHTRPERLPVARRRPRALLRQLEQLIQQL